MKFKSVRLRTHWLSANCYQLSACGEAARFPPMYRYRDTGIKTKAGVGSPLKNRDTNINV